MPKSTSRLRAAAVCPLLVWCSLALAQALGPRAAPEAAKPAAPLRELAKPDAAKVQTPKPEPAKAPAAAPVAPAAVPAVEPAAPRVEEAQPPVYYLKDEQGRLQAVLGYTLEDFTELLKLKLRLGQPDQPPRYSLERMLISGTAAGENADLSIQFSVRVREDGWARVPLRLGRAVLDEPVQYKGPGEQVLRFEAEEGYVSWIRGQPGRQNEPHELTLKVLAPLAGIGDQTRLRLLAPRATSSELKIRVPVAGATATVSEGATLLPPARAGNGATELTVVGLGGDFELTWQRPAARAAETAAALEAVGAILVRADNRNVESEAQLTVRSYGTPFDRFRVRLPPGAELIPGTPSGYTVVPIADAKGGPRQNLVEVRLAKRTSAPIEVRLATRLSRAGGGGAASWIELAGFEVVEAARQWGQIAVAAAGDWQVLWGPSLGVRQVDQLPAALRQKDVVAGFEYFAQPCSLSARLVPRKTRVGVEPEYVLLVDSDEVRLEAKLQYTIRGAKVVTLDVMLPGWELDEVGPENLVAVDGVAMSDANVLSIPLVQPSSGQIELQIRAHRPIKADVNPLVVPLPQPVVSSLGPAAVIVAPAGDVELTPSNEAMVGLLRQPVGPQIELPGRQQERLYYRCESPKAIFAAGFRVLPQKITAEVASEVRLGEQSAEVQQKLTYLIAHQPADYFTIEVPRSLAAEPGMLALEHEGKPLVPKPVPEEQTRQDPSQPARMRVALPGGCIGTCVLTVRYPLPVPKRLRSQAALLTIPLVMPGAGELTGNKLQVRTVPGVEARYRPSPKAEPRAAVWTVVDDGGPQLGSLRALQLSAARRTAQVELTLHWEEGAAGGATVVDRAWVQTWLGSSARQEGGSALRQDRAVFSFTTSRKELELVLPAGAALSQALLRLDDKPVAVRAGGEGRLLIPLSGEGGPRQHRLELWYHFPDQRPAGGRTSVEIPQLGDDAWICRMYWQLVLPPHEHLLIAPRGFTSEFTWGWAGYYWGRRPLLEQPQLEAWLGVPNRSAASERTNRYLFSAWGNVKQLEFYTLSRSWIVFLASGAALVAGLLLIYVPAFRHPLSLLGAAVVLLAAGLLCPEPMLLASQAASLGLALTLVAGLLKRGVAQRRAAALPESSSVSLEMSSTHAPRQPSAAGNPASTQSAPAVVPPAPEANA